MPIISNVNTRNWRTRTVYGVIFSLLILGALTMIYPFLLMISGSVKSESDAFLISPYPEFWFSDKVLFQKYAESKHNASPGSCSDAWGTSIAGWRSALKPIEKPTSELVEDFDNWRKTKEALHMSVLGHSSGARLMPQNQRLFRKRMIKKYEGDIARFRRETGSLAAWWYSVNSPVEIIGRYRNTFVDGVIRKEFADFKSERPSGELFFPLPSSKYKYSFLAPKYGNNIYELNAAYGSSYIGFDEIPLPHNVSMCASDVAREDWLEFVRKKIDLFHIRLPAEASDMYKKFITNKYGTIDSYNKIHGTLFASFDNIKLPLSLDDDPDQRVDWEAFLEDSEYCKAEWPEIYGPEEMFTDYRKALGRENTSDFSFGSLAHAADYRDCIKNKRALRSEFTTRNYKHVIEYISTHGNGIINTLIYCLLAVTTSLVVNPLAAYALSRFKLPSTYRILLFCMATMAFPGEVSMIPSFILMKRFPLWPILGAVVTIILSFLVFEKILPRTREAIRASLSAVAGIIVGAIALPSALGEKTTVNLLNTFSALILPGVANGYFIFLLKGFFDSMPKELYEAAEIDGAGEWTKFWSLTMTLSKPILAVIALGAFTSAYSAFMMALIIIPDERMWTIMVWIFQLQSQANGAVVYASLIIAAIPTFLIFALCQNVIIRGIVVPTEK